MDSQKEILLRETYDIYMGLLTGYTSISELEKVTVPNLMGYGTTKDERVFDRSGLESIILNQREVEAQVTISYEVTHIHKHYSTDENAVVWVDEVQVLLKSKDGNNVIPVRLSSVFYFFDNQWKLVHWHASAAVETENDTWHLNEWKQKNEQLQKLVEEKSADLLEKYRELEIEAALERIRSQVTAMRESSDLLDIVVTMRAEFVKLGHEAHYFWHMRWLTDQYDKAMTSGDGSRIGMVMTLPRHIHGDIQPVAEWERSTDPTYVLAMDADTAVDYVHKMITLGDFEQVDPQAPTLDDIRHIGGLTFVMARTTHGEIGYSLPGVVPSPPKDAVDTLVRFASVFDLAYMRFEDLKVSERQHREAQIELALERVRARSLAMYNTNELTEIIKSVDDQFKELSVSNSGGAFIVINKDLEDGFSCWGSGGVGNYVRKVDIPYLDSPIYRTLNEGIIKRTPFFTEQYDEEVKHAFFRHLFSHPPFNVTPIERQQALLTLSDGYSRSCVVSENTSIFIINHHGVPFSEEENGILRQMGRVFEQSYTRYLDIEKAEKQAKLIREERDNLELAINELHATQSQLIQQEKLASLGQLTAGIAHEIKNPLNFVNNFSSVSLEMIDEALDELRKEERRKKKEDGDPALDVAPALALDLALVSDILADIRQNLTKIFEHGSRADGIVKSMLQHSRGGSGKMEPTDLNALVKEFANLSYHGMRAGKNPIEVDVTIDLDGSIGDVPLVYEDFSRVILNICSNAFDAMRGSVIGDQGSATTPKASSFLKDGVVIPTKSGPSPEVTGGTAHLTVRTRRAGDRITIEIEDNGPGIPDDIKDKILQPFFTTKKGTQGTGLGLSITHDIVKAHGGELDIESGAGRTVFRIKLIG